MMNKNIRIVFNSIADDLVISGHSVDDINKMLSSWLYGEKPIDIFCKERQERFFINPMAVAWIKDEAGE